jgi:HlyD family secretion protein
MYLNPSGLAARSTTRRGGALPGLILAAAVFTGLCFVGYQVWQRSQANVGKPNLIVETVSRGPFDHIVLEQGELESSSNVDVLCQVRARTGGTGTPILWVIDEGTTVKAGEKLVELDASAWKTALRDKRIVVIGAESTVAAAEAAVEQAKIARQEYLEGLFETEERAIQSEMAIAEQELRKAQLALQSSERLVARGLIKSLQLEADQFAVANSRNKLEGAENRLRVLQNLTRQKMLVEFDSAIDSAEAALAAALGSLEEEQTDLKDIENQIELCTIYAPADGIVIHANTSSGRGGGGGSEVVIEPGTIIRERQTIIRLPDPRKMQVRAKVNESRITLIEPGMPVKIRVDAVNNMELLGRVIKVNRYAEPGSWFSTSIKEYATIIEIAKPPESIRTGMTAEVQIFVKQLPNAIQVPIQAIYEHGGQTYSLVRKGENEFETRKVAIGATNERNATIVDGISVDETVVLNLRQNLSLLDLPNVAPTDDTLLARLVGEGMGAAAATGDAASPREGGSPTGGAPTGGQPGGSAGERGGQAGGSAPQGNKPQGDAAGAPAERPAASDRAGRGQDADRGENADSRPSADAAAQSTDTPGVSVTEVSADPKSRSQSYLERISAARKVNE